MEPPAKRLRILRSVEVDDNDPDLAQSRQKARAVLKSKMEMIFAKYENMSESRSDEIDMITNEVVVDRGHLRSLRNDKRGMMAMDFLQDFRSDDLKSGWAAYDDSSEDELVPSEAAKLAKPKQNPSGQTTEADQDPRVPPAEVAANEQRTTTVEIEHVPLPLQPVEQHGFTAPMMHTPTQLLQALVPALQSAQIPQLAHTAHTQVGMTSQNALLTGLGQAVLQVVAQILPQAYSNPQTAGTPFLPGMQSIHSPQHVTAASPTSKPASDPKWYHPPLPAQSPLPTPASSVLQSSPTTNTMIRKRRSAQQLGRTSQRQASSLPKDSNNQANVENFHHASSHKRAGKIRTTYERQRPTDELISSMEDSSNAVSMKVRDIINSQRDADRQAEADTLSSQTRPIRAVGGTTDSQSRKRRRVEASTEQCASPTYRNNPLPTPSSSLLDQTEKDEMKSIYTDWGAQTRFPNASRGYSAEDLELLSLAGSSEHEEPLSITGNELESHKDDESDIAVPSIESDDSQSYQKELDSVIESRRSLVEVRIPIKQEPVPQRSSPLSEVLNDLHSSTPNNRRGRATTVDSDSQDLDLLPTESTPRKPAPAPLNRCATPVEISTPTIKREPSTPGTGSLFLTRLPCTPKTAPQFSMPNTSIDSKSTGRLSKSQFARQVRAQWARSARKIHGLRKAQSLQLNRIRVKIEDSEDELA